jgi:hypothetical protein
MSTVFETCRLRRLRGGTVGLELVTRHPVIEPVSGQGRERNFRPQRNLCAVSRDSSTRGTKFIRTPSSAKRLSHVRPRTQAKLKRTLGDRVVSNDSWLSSSSASSSSSSESSSGSRGGTLFPLTKLQSTDHVKKFSGTNGVMTAPIREGKLERALARTTSFEHAMVIRDRHVMSVVT